MRGSTIYNSQDVVPWGPTFLPESRLQPGRSASAAPPTRRPQCGSVTDLSARCICRPRGHHPVPAGHPGPAEAAAAPRMGRSRVTGLVREPARWHLPRASAAPPVTLAPGACGPLPRHPLPGLLPLASSESVSGRGRLCEEPTLPASVETSLEPPPPGLFKGHHGTASSDALLKMACTPTPRWSSQPAFAGQSSWLAVARP